MKLTLGCLTVLFLWGCCALAGTESQPPERRPDESPAALQTNIARVVDFEDSGHHLLIWNITFQTADGRELKCQMPYGADFVKFAGLDGLNPFELDQKTDFSALPWLKITIQEGRTMGLRRPLPQYRLMAWEKVEMKKAEPQGGGYSPPAARPAQPTP